MENERTILTNSEIAKLPKWAVDKFVAIDRAKKDLEQRLSIYERRNNFNTGVVINDYGHLPILLPEGKDISFNLAAQEPVGDHRVIVHKNLFGLLEVRGTTALQVYPRAANDIHIGLVGHER